MRDAIQLLLSERQEVNISGVAAERCPCPTRVTDGSPLEPVCTVVVAACLGNYHLRMQASRAVV